MAKVTWKLREGTTWRQKLEQEHPNHGKVVPIPDRMRKRLGTGTMIIPRPLDLDALIRKVRKEKLVTQSQLRAAVARQSNVDSACPMTTGMFLRIIAETAEEDRRAGKKRITPYWRVVRDDGRLNDKFPGGADAQASKLREEGFDLEPARGKQPPRVSDLDKHRAKLP